MKRATFPGGCSHLKIASAWHVAFWPEATLATSLKSCRDPPAGRHDNQVDAIGLVGQLLENMVPPAKVKPKVPTMWDRWDREEQPATNWKVV